MDKILSLIDNNPQTVAIQIARRIKERRLELNLTQEGLAMRAGMKLSTYRRFERTGIISLKGLLQMALALNLLKDFNVFFDPKQYQLSI